MDTQLLPPVHPGEVLLKDLMEPLDISINALANAIGVSPSRVHQIVKGQRGITGDTALRLGRYFDQTAEFWMNLQQQYELEVARRSLGDSLRSIKPRKMAA